MPALMSRAARRAKEAYSAGECLAIIRVQGLVPHATGVALTLSLGGRQNETDTASVGWTCQKKQ